ncbi:hypothetical protein [Shewanella woodyi]|uniref:hypothetical protein n=1 Tax=Shewanella woodyi TaxID=60961 RepID=UPI00374A414D
MAYPLKHVRTIPTSHAAQSSYRCVVVNCVHGLTAFPPFLAAVGRSYGDSHVFINEKGFYSCFLGILTA